MNSVIKCRLFIPEQRLFRDGKSYSEMISRKDSCYNHITVVRGTIHNCKMDNKEKIINTTIEE